MPKVYVTQEKARKQDGIWIPEFDITPAAEFGKIEILLPPGQSFFSTVPTIRMLKEKLKDFTEDDYLLPMGDPSIMIAAAMVAGEISGGKVKLLKWDRFQQVYVEIKIDTSGRAT